MSAAHPVEVAESLVGRRFVCTSPPAAGARADGVETVLGLVRESMPAPGDPPMVRFVIDYPGTRQQGRGCAVLDHYLATRRPVDVAPGIVSE